MRLLLFNRMVTGWNSSTSQWRSGLALALLEGDVRQTCFDVQVPALHPDALDRERRDHPCSSCTGHSMLLGVGRSASHKLNDMPHECTDALK